MSGDAIAVDLEELELPNTAGRDFPEFPKRAAAGETRDAGRP